MLNKQIDLLTSFPYRQMFEKRYVQHIIFWVAYIGFFTFLQYTLRPESIRFRDILLFESNMFIGQFAIVYINLRFFIPKLLEKKKYFYYIPILFVTMFIISITVTNIHDVLPFSENFSRPRNRHRGPEFFIFMNLMSQLFFVAITSFLHFLKKTLQLQDVELKIKELENVNYKTELDSLKAQINPHFLFNTLNNIYSHSLLEKERVPEMILKLSDLMHYILYECQEEWVPLSKEIKFICNYIELEKVRVDESFSININIENPENGFHIAPLIFILFLENAFKHGINIEKGNPFIHVDLKIVDEHVLDFFVENSSAESTGGSDVKGIGLENVKKRLELIYPNKHQLDISNEDGRFKVNLTIQLDE